MTKKNQKIICPCRLLILQSIYNKNYLIINIFFNRFFKMPVTGRQIIQAVSQLTELEEMQITIKESAKWAAITGAAVMTGGMLFGPVGLALGGIIGGVAGAMQEQGKQNI